MKEDTDLTKFEEITKCNGFRGFFLTSVLNNTNITESLNCVVELALKELPADPVERDISTDFIKLEESNKDKPNIIVKKKRFKCFI